MQSSEEIIEKFIKSRMASGAQTNGGVIGITLGVVIDTDDPLQCGRLKVFCPSLNDDPKQLQYIPWCAYASPFSGSINNSSYTRGNDLGPAESNGSLHYGFWAIPEMGAHVLVTCIDGDFRRRVWLSCLPQHQDNNTLHTGRWKWKSGKVDGPLTSDDSPMQPQYENMLEAFDGKNDSPEWKTRVAEYQPIGVRDDYNQTPNSKKSNYIDRTIKSIIENEPRDWTHTALGSHGYDWSGFKNMGAFLSSRTYGFSSPGMHTFFMDDRPFNNRIKIKTTSGHVILLDDTNERIYISTCKGKNWVEMDCNGNIDVHSENRISINAAKDVNITTEETFRVHAKKGIHFFSGINEQQQEELEDEPEPGQIRFHAQNDINVITEKNYRHLSVLDSLYEIGGKKCETVGNSFYLQVQNDINILTNTGDYNLTVSNDLNEFVQRNVRKYALGTMKNMSEGDAQMHSFTGKMDIGAQKTINAKSFGEDIILEAVGKNEDRSGGVYSKSPLSLVGVTSEGIGMVTQKNIQQKAAETIDQEINEEIDMEPPEENADVPEECPIDGLPPIEGYTGADLAARLAYRAGFRGKDLIIATAIAGAESSYNPNAVNVSDGRAVKWGPSYGLWQIRTLRRPEEWTGLDRKRDANFVGGAENAQNNANVAYEIYQRSNFREWSVYTNGMYKNYMTAASAAVNSMCGGALMELSNSEYQFENAFSQSLDLNNCPLSIIKKNACSPQFKLSNNTSISMNIEGLNLQSKLDTAFKSIASRVQTKLAEGIVSTINANATALNNFQAKALSFMNLVASPISDIFGFMNTLQSLASFMENFNLESRLLAAIGIQLPYNMPITIADIVPDFPFEQILGEICNFKVPEFERAIDANFRLNGADLCVDIEIENDTPLFKHNITVR